MRLSNVVAEYVSFKQGIGMWYRSEAKLLRSFCRTVGDVAIKEVDAPSVEAFLAGVKGNIASVWRLKYTVLNGLFRFAINRKYIGSSPLPRILPKRPEPGLPHIYTIDELQSLLKATDSLRTKMSPLQAATFRMLLLILYGTGLRISEALALTIADVDVRNSLIIVRDSKFFKTRIVPTGPRLTGHLRSYLEERRRLARPLGEDSAFLATRTGHALSYHQASSVFRRLRNLTGLHRKDGARYAPRIHDIRHSFCVHRLESWYREGADVQRLLPQLSTYLGHVGIAETQRYLTMTPELLREANRRFERYALPEVNHD
jgi:integrase/recombinase XerD